MSKKITINCTEEEFKKISDLAADNDTSISKYCHQFIFEGKKKLKAIDEKDKAESVSSVYIKNDDLTDILEEVRRLNNEISVVINTGYLVQGFTDIEKNQLIELVKEIEEKVIDVTSTTFDTRKELRDEARKLIRKKNGGD